MFLIDYASMFAPQIDKAYDAAMNGLPSRLVDIQVCLCHSGRGEMYIFFGVCYFVSFFTAFWEGNLPHLGAKYFVL